jgi:ABC-type transport system involved in multi-copper enzyme maturation permease subunit
MTALAAASAALVPTRLTLRLHRFEVFAFLALMAFSFGLAFLVAARLDGLRFDPRCYDPTGSVEPSTICQLAMNRFNEMVNDATKVSAIVTLVPFLGALLLGTPVVGRELERGTTRLAWALAPSRRRWFLHRLLPVLAVATVGSLVLGIAADRLLAASHPGLDVSNAFAEYGFRGVVLAGRAVFVFTLAVLVGAVMGRALPALIVSGLLAFIAIAGLTMLNQLILNAEAIRIDDPSPSNPGTPGDLYLDQRFQLPDGTLIGWEQVEQYDPMPTDPQSTGDWPTLPRLTFGVRGTRYGEVQAREVAALAGAGLVALAATAFIVGRRRPG